VDKQELALKLNYDIINDVLYCSFGEIQEGVGIEVYDGMVVRVNPETDQPVGVTISGFRKRFADRPEETLTLPVHGIIEHMEMIA
jgi:hypothetical protein